MTKEMTFISVLLGFLITIQAQTWEQIGADIDGEGVDDLSGYSVSLSSDGAIVAIGAHIMTETAANQVMYGFIKTKWNMDTNWR